MNQSTTNVLIGFGALLIILMLIIVAAIAINNSLGTAAIFLCVLSGLGATMLSSVFTAIDKQREFDRARERKQRQQQQQDTE